MDQDECGIPRRSDSDGESASANNALDAQKNDDDESESEDEIPAKRMKCAAKMYFSSLDKEGIYKCNLCLKNIVTNSGTTNLWTHLKHKHPSCHTEAMKAKNGNSKKQSHQESVAKPAEESRNLNTVKKRQLTILEAAKYGKERNRKAEEMILRMLIVHNTEPDILTCDYFIQVLKIGNININIKPEEVPNMIKARYEAYFQIAKKKLGRSHGYTLELDILNDDRFAEEYLVISASQFCDQSSMNEVYVLSCCLLTLIYEASDVVGFLEAAMETWGLTENKKYATIVIGKHSVLQEAACFLNKEGTFITRCLKESLNGLKDKIDEHMNSSSLVLKIKSIADFFKNLQQPTIIASDAVFLEACKTNEDPLSWITMYAAEVNIALWQLKVSPGEVVPEMCSPEEMKAAKSLVELVSEIKQGIDELMKLPQILLSEWHLTRDMFLTLFEEADDGDELDIYLLKDIMRKTIAESTIPTVGNSKLLGAATLLDPRTRSKAILSAEAHRQGVQYLERTIREARQEMSKPTDHSTLPGEGQTFIKRRIADLSRSNIRCSTSSTSSTSHFGLSADLKQFLSEPDQSLDTQQWEYWKDRSMSPLYGLSLKFLSAFVSKGGPNSIMVPSQLKNVRTEVLFLRHCPAFFWEI